jgi:hypothetical protein
MFVSLSQDAADLVHSMSIERWGLTLVHLGSERGFELYCTFGKPKGGQRLEPPRVSWIRRRRRALDAEIKTARST